MSRGIIGNIHGFKAEIELALAMYGDQVTLVHFIRIKEGIVNGCKR